jgi:hypothetical protein
VCCVCCVNWVRLDQNRVQWWALAILLPSYWILENPCNILTCYGTCVPQEEVRPMQFPDMCSPKISPYHVVSLHVSPKKSVPYNFLTFVTQEEVRPTQFLLSHIGQLSEERGLKKYDKSGAGHKKLRLP